MSMYAKNQVQRQREQQLAVSIAQQVNILDSKQWLLAETKKRLYNIDNNPLRKDFLDRYFAFTHHQGIEIKKIPVVAKMPLDLFKLYMTVRQHGGLAQVVKQRCWNVIVREIGLPLTITSAAYTLREKYYRLLYPFEKYEKSLQQNSKAKASEERNTSMSKVKSYEEPATRDRENFEYSRRNSASMATSPTTSSAYRRSSENKISHNNVSDTKCQRTRLKPSTMLKIHHIFHDRIELEYYSDGKRYTGFLPVIP